MDHHNLPVMQEPPAVLRVVHTDLHARRVGGGVGDFADVPNLARNRLPRLAVFASGGILRIAKNTLGFVPDVEILDILLRHVQNDNRRLHVHDLGDDHSRLDEFALFHRQADQPPVHRGQDMRPLQIRPSLGIRALADRLPRLGAVHLHLGGDFLLGEFLNAIVFPLVEFPIGLGQLHPGAEQIGVEIQNRLPFVNRVAFLDFFPRGRIAGLCAGFRVEYISVVGIFVDAGGDLGGYFHHAIRLDHAV